MRIWKFAELHLATGVSASAQRVKLGDAARALLTSVMSAKPRRQGGALSQSYGKGTVDMRRSPKNIENNPHAK